MDNPVIPTGFRALDEKFGGFKAGEMILFSAGSPPPRPSRGASGLGIQMMLQHVRNGGAILYYDTEASISKEIIDRYLCDNQN